MNVSGKALSAYFISLNTCKNKQEFANIRCVSDKNTIYQLSAKHFNMKDQAECAEN